MYVTFKISLALHAHPVIPHLYIDYDILSANIYRTLSRGRLDGSSVVHHREMVL